MSGNAIQLQSSRFHGLRTYRETRRGIGQRWEVLRLIAKRRPQPPPAPARAARWSCVQEKPTGGVRPNAQPAFGLPEVLAVVHTSHLSCRKAGKRENSRWFWVSSGESRLNVVSGENAGGGSAMSDYLQNFDFTNGFNILRLICGLFFIPHIYAKFYVLLRHRSFHHDRTYLRNLSVHCRRAWLRSPSRRVRRDLESHQGQVAVEHRRLRVLPVLGNLLFDRGDALSRQLHLDVVEAFGVHTERRRIRGHHLGNSCHLISCSGWHSG
jgi:hypothetical protein